MKGEHCTINCRKALSISSTYNVNNYFVERTFNSVYVPHAIRVGIMLRDLRIKISSGKIQKRQLLSNDIVCRSTSRKFACRPKSTGKLASSEEFRVQQVEYGAPSDSRLISKWRKSRSPATVAEPSNIR